MRMIRPIDVTDAILTASNLPENDYPEWVSGTTYNLGDKVIKASTHRIYESVTGSNTDDPEVGVDAAPPTWLDIAPTNKWAPFDEKIGTQAVGAGTIDPSYLIDDSAANGISYTFTPSALVDGLALINISGVVLYVKIETSTEGLVYSNRIELASGMANSTWWNYYFDAVVRDTQAVLTELPMGLDSIIHVALSTDAGDAEMGALVFGRDTPIGCTQYGSGFGIKDYSLKAIDDFGNTTVTKRGFSRRAEMDVQVENNALAAVGRALTLQRSKPTVYMGPVYDPLTVYGFPTDWFITVSSHPFSELTISLEGLT